MKIKHFFIFFLVFFIAAPYASALTVDEVSPRGAQPTVAGVQTGSLLGQIQQAKQLLASVKLNADIRPVYKNVTTGTGKKKKTTQKLTGYQLNAKDLAIAFLDPRTDEIKITVAMQKDKDFTFPDKNYRVEKVRFNGVNTAFRINDPAGGKVLAIKYLITNPESGSLSAIKQGMYDAVYVPYTRDLHTAEVANAGAQYLDSIMNQVASQLSHVSSVSVPGKSVIEAVNPKLVKSLVYAEHLDTTEFLNNPDTQYLIDKVNVLFGGNESNTYRYSVSSAGARGISQFMPGTYAGLVKRHPQANLIKDFVAGMNDHTNSIKATYLLLDDYIASVRDRAAEHFIPAHAFDYGAAAYNGGTVRVARAAKTYGPFWYESQPDIETALRNETVNYMKKVHRVIQVLNGQSPLLN